MEFLSPIALVLLFSLALLLVGWFCLSRLEERAKEIIHYLSRLRGEFGKFWDDFGLLGKHLSHAQSSYQSTERRLEQFGQRLLSVDANQEFVEFRSYDRKMG